MNQPPITSIKLLNQVYNHLFPLVEEEVSFWWEKASKIPNRELRHQALASIQTKKFHCQGGSVFALLADRQWKKCVRFIVAYQTISDYLDNLCDRSTSLDPKDFKLLHDSMHDALTPDSKTENYYAYRREQDDGGYLQELVMTCQHLLSELDQYDMIKNNVVELEGLYADLQVYKHIKEEERVPRLIQWYKNNKERALGLTWYEFAATSGSTLGVFCLVSYAFANKMTVKLSNEIVHGYFPYVQGLHILLDYYIDQEEDREEGDLNFCHYYKDDVQMVERISYFILRADESLQVLPDSRFHRLIVKGLVALYLSDEKVNALHANQYIKQRLIKATGITGKFIHSNIKLYYRVNRMRKTAK